MPSTALAKLKAHLHTAIDLLLTGDKEQKAIARKVLTDFLKREVARTEGIEDPSTTQTPPADGWVCFHCGKRLTTREAAVQHFGSKAYATPICFIETKQGQTLLSALKIATEERNYLIEMLDTIHIIDTNDFTKQGIKHVESS